MQSYHKKFSSPFIRAVFSQVVCGQNCTFLVQANGTVLAVGEGSYGRLGQGNSDDLYTPTIISALQGNANSKLIFRPVPVMCVVHSCDLFIIVTDVN